MAINVQNKNTGGFEHKVCTNYPLAYAKLDKLLIGLLLFLGWSLEWNFGDMKENLPYFFVYLRIIAPTFVFSCYLVYYLKQKNIYKNVNSDSAFLKPIGWICFVFAGIVIAERIANDFQDTALKMKYYYYLMLLPFWGWLGFDIGSDNKRALNVIHRLAVYSAMASYLSFAMTITGVLKTSHFGPMYWPYRFIVIFGFFYFITSLATGINRTRSTLFWMLGCSLAVFWGFYKYTIVSTVLGLVVWIIFLLAKGKGLRGRSILSFCLILLIGISGVFVTNQITEGHLFAIVNDIFEDHWVHNITEFEDPDLFERVNLISGDRLKIWEEGIKRVQFHPLIGSGLGQVCERNMVFHNGYIDLLLSFGLLGAGGAVAAFFIWFKALCRSEPSGYILFILLVCTGFIATILAANMFGSVWIQFHTISAYLLLAGGVSYRLSKKSIKG
jgi:hypothetical protein